jgi:hypothetical protein
MRAEMNILSAHFFSHDGNVAPCARFIQEKGRFGDLVKEGIMHACLPEKICSKV